MLLAVIVGEPRFEAFCRSIGILEQAPGLQPGDLITCAANDGRDLLHPPSPQQLVRKVNQVYAVHHWRGFESSSQDGARVLREKTTKVVTTSRSEHVLIVLLRIIHAEGISESELVTAFHCRRGEVLP